MNNPFNEAINQAARKAGHTDYDQLPEGLSPRERKEQLLKMLRNCAYDDDHEREGRIRARYPAETERMRVKRQPALAWEQKDRTYYSGFERLVRRWATVEGAAEVSDSQDVDWLNEQPGPATYPAKLLSRPMSKKVLANTVTAALPGLTLPKDCETLSDIKRMIRAAKLNSAAGAVPFGSIAKRVGNQLVGKSAVTVGENGSRPAIRITVDGKRLWLRLDVFEVGLDAIGYGAALDQASPDEDAGGSGDSMVMNVVNNLSWESGLERPERSPESAVPRESGLASPSAPSVLRESELDAPKPRPPADSGEQPPAEPTGLARLIQLRSEREAHERARADELEAIYASGGDPLET